MSCTVLAVAVMPTYELHDALLDDGVKCFAQTISDSQNARISSV
jgi:hypothetical protein